MGNKIETKLIILCGLFLVTSALVYKYQNKTYATEKDLFLKDYLSTIPGYKSLREVELSKEHFNMLKLDDYLYKDYEGKDGKINLYIGYYYFSKKAYASHSPLICYPSQGWEIDKTATVHTLNFGPYKINYEEIVTSFDEHQELVIYWYQSHLQTNTQVFKNKIDMGYNKLLKNDEQHGFVRVSTPLQNSRYEEAQKAATEFVKAFYPRFIDFIEEN